MLDFILLALVVLFAVSGYRQGFIVGVLSFVGFVGGGVLGAMIAPPIARAVVQGAAQQALLAIVIAFLAATLGQLIASSAGAVLRNRVTGDNARAVDAVGGSLVSAVSLLLVAWFIGTAVAGSPFGVLRKQVKSSSVLGAVDDVMPDTARGWFSSFKGFVSKTEFPQVFGGLGGESVVRVPPPDTDVLKTEELRRTQRSIVKIIGTAPECQRKIEGTGFVYARDRVMTNAHVVAGVQGFSQVVTQNNRFHRARVVLYDPKRDIAVLHVPDLSVPSLKFNGEAQTRDSAVVAGFPKGRPFTAVAARIRAKQRAKGPDIYHAGQVTREIYAIRGKVQQGNSGGPLLAANGTVYGVIFAAALDDEETGYALTAHEVAGDAQAGQNATSPVSTQTCSD
ncbi:MarP family serine protease [Actinomadura sp. HBU206391]|uniref:MarP family serine protease n=1 Tax=Actinomadura sp. HBU206391 TaxID=2731692 RepID=UPI00164F13BC|nr:MarP family serine protease [Actinomadura sp. HBU206391]MBC6456325.1 MarP family serine protease [Actinomadura sp. HBU206391]